MQFINRNVHARVEVGHIDLLDKISYIEVAEDVAPRVMKYLNGAIYKGRRVRCNDADDDAPAKPRARQQKRQANRPDSPKKQFGKDDWRSLIAQNPAGFKGEEPDFSEEGWARRKKKK